MKILRNNISDSEFYNYYLIDDNKKLGIIYCDNGDLYFTSFDKNQENDFFITKENIIIYNLFDALYKSFKSGEVFQVSEKVFNSEKINWISDNSISFDYKNADSMTISYDSDYHQVHIEEYLYEQEKNDKIE